MLITLCYRAVAKLLFFPKRSIILRLSRGNGGEFFPVPGCEKRKNREIFVQKNDLTFGKKKVTKCDEILITNSNIFLPDL